MKRFLLLQACVDHRDEIKWIKYLKNCMRRFTPFPDDLIGLVFKYMNHSEKYFTQHGQTHKPIKIGSYDNPNPYYIGETKPCKTCGEHYCISYRDPYNFCYSAYRPFKIYKGLLYCDRCYQFVGDVATMSEIYHCRQCDCQPLSQHNITPLQRTLSRSHRHVKRNQLPWKHCHRPPHGCHDTRQIKTNSSRKSSNNKLVRRMQNKKCYDRDIREPDFIL